jgi:PAS domain S-box-containing protein
MVFDELGYQFFLDKSNDAIIIHNYKLNWEEERILVANTAALKLCGYSREELLTFSPLSLVPPSNRQSVIMLHNMINMVQNFVLPAYFQSKTGESIAVEISSKMFEYNNEKYFFTTLRDLSSRQEIEEKLLESEQMLTSVINSIPMGVYWKDLESKYLGCNLVFARAVSKKNPEEVIGLTDYDLNPYQGTAEKFREEDARIIQTNTPEFNILSQYTNLEGKNMTLLKSKIPLRNAQGEVIGILGVFQDITEKEFMDYVFEKLQKEMLIRNRIIESFLTSQESDVYYDILQIILDFFHSSIGSFSYIENNEENVLAILSSVNDRDGLNEITVSDTDIWGQISLVNAIQSKKIAIHTFVATNQKNNFEKSVSTNDEKIIYGILCPIVHQSHVIALVRLTNSNSEYTKEELELLQMISINIAPIINAKLERDKEGKARTIAEEKLKLSLHEKEVLLREIHHRVKNNLQIISSLITLQTRTISDEKVIHVFKDFQNRVRSLALVHENLYRAEDLGHINISTYFGNLIRNLYRSFQTNMEQISYSLDIEPINLSINQIQLTGLIINELVSNCLKYAFPNNRIGKIQIHLYSKGKLIIVEVEDDGVGIPSDKNFPSTSNIGLELVHLLSDQLKGNIEMKKEKGTKFILRFPK